MEERNGYIFVPWKEWLHDSASVVNPRWGIELPAQYLVKHHTPGIDPATYEDAVDALNGVWYYHTFVAEGGWGWIGYNTIGWGRFIFEGAGIGNRGIHAPGANGISHGHAFLLDSRIRQPTQEEWSALRAFCGDLVSWGYLNNEVLVPDSGYNTVHHDWVSTSCAGPGVDESSNRFYNTSPNPNPDPTPRPERRKGGKVIPKLVRDNSGSPVQFPNGTAGVQWGPVAFDLNVPAGYKIGVSSSNPERARMTVGFIVNGNVQTPGESSRGVPVWLEITQDSFVSVLVGRDYMEDVNISVG